MGAKVLFIAGVCSSVLLDLLSLIFLLTVSHKFSMGYRSGMSKMSGQLSTVIPWSVNQLLATKRHKWAVKNEVLNKW